MTVTADRESRVVVENDGSFLNPIDLDQYVESDTHLEVYADEVLLTLGVDYTVVGVGDNDGVEITIEAPGVALAPDVWVVFHNPPLDQGADLSLGGQFGLAYEQALDATMRRVQSIADKLKRGLSLSITTPTDLPSLELPPAIPNRGFKWDPTGTFLISTTGDPDEAQDATSQAVAAAASALAAANSAIAAANSAISAAASALEAAASATDADWNASIGTLIQGYSAQLASLAALGSSGILARTAANTITARSIAGVAGQTSVSNGNGVSGNPTIGIADPLTLTALDVGSIGATTRGTIAGTSGSFNTTLSVTGAATFGSTMSVAGVLTGANGTAAAPAFRFLSTASGMYRNSDGGPGFSVAGAAKGGFHATGFSTPSDNSLISGSGPTVGASISYVGAYSSYVTTGINVTCGRNGDGVVASFTRAGVNKGTIDIDSVGTGYNVTSDETMKHFIGPYDPQEAIRIIRADPVREYTWKENREFDIGWGAQTSHKVASRLATPGKGKPGKKNYQPWGMDHSKRVPYLWAAMSDVLDRLDRIEQKLGLD